VQDRSLSTCVTRATRWTGHAPCASGWIVERRRGVCRSTGVRLGGRIAPTPRCSASVLPPTPPPDRDVPQANVAEVNVDGGAGSGQELASGVGPSSPTGHASWRVGLMSRYRISAPRPLPVLACPPARLIWPCPPPSRTGRRRLLSTARPQGGDTSTRRRAPRCCITRALDTSGHRPLVRWPPRRTNCRSWAS